jgi:hypothetical protein
MVKIVSIALVLNWYYIAITETWYCIARKKLVLFILDDNPFWDFSNGGFRAGYVRLPAQDMSGGIIT